MEKIDIRREKILSSLKTANVSIITTMADMLKVSTKTKRRDL
jgi:DeoR/GlpR family transcriptional regulator of sugar metabolism